MQSLQSESRTLARLMLGQVRKSRAQAQVDRVTEGWSNAPSIIVFYGLDDPAISQVRSLLTARLAQHNGLGLDEGNPEAPLGFEHLGVVYVNSEAATSSQELVATILHECVGHYGLRGAFGRMLDPALKKLIELRPQDVSLKQSEYKLPETEEGLLIAAEEVLADIAEKNPEFSLVDQATAAIAGWLRKNIPAIRKVPYTQSEIVRNFILPARDFVRSGRALQAQQVKEAGLIASSEEKSAPQDFPDYLPTNRSKRTQRNASIIRNSFTGASSKSADLFALKTAKSLLLDGHSTDAVLEATGWRKGPDEKWRFEISDDQAQLKIRAYKSNPIAPAIAEWSRKNDQDLTLGDILDHPKMFAAYPDLAGYRVNFGEKSSGYSNGSIADRDIWISGDLGNQSVLSTLLHEAQHAIQSIEGFANGGSPGLTAWTTPQLRPALLEEVRKGIKTLTPPTYEAYWGPDKSPEGDAAYRSFIEEWNSPQYIRKMEIAIQTGAPALIYKRLYGEIEARNTQARMKLSEQDRKLQPATLTQDVPDEDAILIFNGIEIAQASVGVEAATEPSFHGLKNSAEVFQAISDKFPSLSTSVGKMIQRGVDGLPGGLVVIESADILDAVRVYAEKTGQSEEDALAMFGLDTQNRENLAGTKTTPPTPDKTKEREALRARVKLAAQKFKESEEVQFLKRNGLEFDLTPYGGALELSSISVDPLFRGRGYGSRALDALTSIASQYGVPVILEVSDEAGIDTPSWYARHGFAWDEDGGYMAFRPSSPQAQTDLPFKLWFTDSKIVDDNGLPLKVYHGTTETKTVAGTTLPGNQDSRRELEDLALLHGIGDPSSVPSIFERWVETGLAKDRGITPEIAAHARSLYEQSKATITAPSTALGFSAFSMPSGSKELGSHFGTKRQAEHFGETFAFYLSIQNPLTLPDLGTWDYQSVMREARKRGVDITEDEYSEVFNAGDNNAALRGLMLSKGYDGIIYKNEAEGEGQSYIAFKPEQIKSATDNNREFDGSNPGVLFSAKLKERTLMTPGFNRWFEGSQAIDSEGNPKKVYRGENSGDLFNVFDIKKTREGAGFFFSESKELANGYTARGQSFREFYLNAKNTLDLTDPWSRSNLKFLAEFEKEFDEWIDRYSGEPTDAASMLESGSLYDYEGTGEGLRWKHLFRFAQSQGFDSVRVLDSTDGVPYAPVWVVFEPAQIKSATDNSGEFSSTNTDIRYSSTSNATNVEASAVPSEDKTEAISASAPLDDDINVDYKLRDKKLLRQAGTKSIWAARPDANPLGTHASLLLQGFTDPYTGLTFVVAPNLTKDSAAAVVLHEVVHSHQRAELDSKAAHLLDNAELQPEPTKAFLGRVKLRLNEAGQSDNTLEAMPYLVEQATLEGYQAGFSRVNPRLLVWIDTSLGSEVGSVVRGFSALLGAFALRFGKNENPSVDEFVALAKMSVRASAQGKTVFGWGLRASSLLSPKNNSQDDVSDLGFFSPLARAVNSLQSQFLTGKAWLENLRSSKLQSLVKKDELEWTGLDKWLAGQPGKISKEEIKTYLDQHAIEVEEEVFAAIEEDDYDINEDDENDRYPFSVSLNGTEIDRFQNIREAKHFVQGEVDARNSTKGAYFKEYSIEGGENYRELLLRQPYADSKYKSKHWSELNVIAHIRFDERKDDSGARVLFVQEMQSDWAQDLRRDGAFGPFLMKIPEISAKCLSISEFTAQQGIETKEWLSERNAMRRDLNLKKLKADDKVMAVYEDGKVTKVKDVSIHDPKRANLEEVTPLPNEFYPPEGGSFKPELVFYEADAVKTHQSNWEKMYRSSKARYEEISAGKASAAPFITTTEGWVNLSLKRIIKIAVDEGFDKVAFVSGEQACEFFNLSKSVSQIIAKKVDEDQFKISIFDKIGQIHSVGNYTTDQLDTVVGKELAKKIAEQETQSATYQDESLKVGGSGMKVFYDQIIPNAAKNLIRKLGGAELFPIGIAGRPKFDLVAESAQVNNNLVLRDRSTNLYLADSEEMRFCEDLKDAEFLKSRGASKALISKLTAVHGNIPQTGFSITQGMRDTVKSGLPLFSLLKSNASQREDRNGRAGFDRWSRDLPLVGNPKTDFSGGGAVFTAYHGSTHSGITQFKRMGSRDGFLGEGPYFTTGVDDVNVNYACVGPDLTTRIDLQKENAEDNMDASEMADILDSYFKGHPDVAPPPEWEDDGLDEAWNKYGSEALDFSVRSNLVGDSQGVVMKVYVRLENPADTTGKQKSPCFSFEEEMDENGEYTGAATGSLLDWNRHTSEVCEAYGICPDDYISALLDGVEDGELGVDRAFSLALSHLTDAYDHDGSLLMPGCIFAEIAEAYGFDGVIMDANLHFGKRRGVSGRVVPGMTGVDRGVLHIVAFKPEQVKSFTGNAGTFSDDSPDIRLRMPRQSKAANLPVTQSLKQYFGVRQVF